MTGQINLKKGIHLVYFEESHGLPAGYYTGSPTSLVGGDATHRGDESKATHLTQKRAKRLIDKARHMGYICRAEPSFTVVY